MNNSVENLEKSVIQLSEVIRKYYIIEDKANIIADKIKTFIGSPTWNRYIESENLNRILWHLNCIITSNADDGHFYIGNNLNLKPPATGTGIERITPNYIKITEFAQMNNEKVRAEYVKAFSQFKSPLTIDLRDCPGGSPESEYFMLCHFFPNGVELFKLLTRYNKPEIFKSVSRFPFYSTYNEIKKFDGEIRVIINGRTASAAESLAFILQNRKRAKIYGSRSGSHAHIQMNVPFKNITVFLPYAKTVDVETGKDWEGVGVIPDYDSSSSEYIDYIFREFTGHIITAVPDENPKNPLRPPTVIVDKN